MESDPNIQIRVNFEEYSEFLKSMAALSRLFSDNDRPYIPSRFVEKLYCRTAGARDLSRDDMSFDAVIDDRTGVGVKTFTATHAKSVKKEKVAQFKASSRSLEGLDYESLCNQVAELRNIRIMSDAHEYDIDVNQSIYHCLVRIPGGAFIHEEPYKPIESNNIKPINRDPSNTSFEIVNNSISFTDGISLYSYSLSDSTLYKTFELFKFSNSNIISLEMLNDPFGHISEKYNTFSNHEELKPKEKQTSIAVQAFVVLPLYSTISAHSRFQVPAKSGINQWNGGGRKRNIYESYKPVPTMVHKKAPGFFPPRDEQFRLKLPNQKIVQAKICQQGDKALMSNPNSELCGWLFDILDPQEGAQQRRFDSSAPYTYADLERIGKDSVIIRKAMPEGNYDYEIQTSELGTYERFVNPEIEDLEPQLDLL